MAIPATTALSLLVTVLPSPALLVLMMVALLSVLVAVVQEQEYHLRQHRSRTTNSY